jgi:hypothetical protein
MSVRNTRTGALYSAPKSPTSRLVASFVAWIASSMTMCLSSPAMASPLGACPSNGSCYAAHDGVGCDDTTCCNTVCALDPFCCSTLWDSICADEAAANCASCGNPNSGDCFDTHGPFCSDESCCDSVCDVDSFCCTSSWDAICVNEAFVECAGCGTPSAQSCYVSHSSVACDDEGCCVAVCSADTFCCESSWDGLCADAAIALCVGCGNPSTGDCFTSHSGPFCDDEGCCSYVCGADSFCCTTTWDGICASEAANLCVSECGGPAEQSCFVASSAACNDPVCCEYVCGIDSFCCNVAWDGLCVSEALDNCILACGAPVAGPCNASHSTPYCSDETCCNAVCAADPFCCNNAWDGICANESNTLCSLCGPCDGDLDGSGAVGPADLATLLGAWGTNSPCPDISGNGVVGPEDLASLLGAWGNCP